MLDIAANRAKSEWTLTEQFGRALWDFFRRPLFLWTPRPLWAWRRVILRLFGARIGRNVRFHPSARIAIPWNLSADDNAAIGDAAILYSLGAISIGRDATISQHAHLCAGSHDFRRADLPLLRGPIAIAHGAWICADAFVGPNVKVGRMAIVGARAVVVRDVPDHAIVVGNPARIVGERPEPRQAIEAEQR